jgi:hypothetical protein
VTDKPTRKLYTPTPRSDERPTVPPPFDIEAFARATTAPDSRPSLPSEPTTQRRPKPAIEGPSSASALLGVIEDSAGPLITQRADDPIAEMGECFSLGDYSGALVIADLVLAADPDDQPVREFRAKCRAALEDVYAFLLGPLERIPVVVMLPEHTGNRATDHRTGLLLSIIDGSSTLDAILDVCGLPRLDALRIVHDLVQSGIVGLK